MKTISVLGRTLETEFLGELGDASVADNVVVHPKTNGIQKRDVNGPSEIAWNFHSSGGSRGIYVQYSSDEELPCELVVNGSTVQSKALFESTHSLKLVDWRFQCSVDLPSGETTLAIRSSGRLPHIRAIALADAPDPPQAAVDDYFALLDDERTSETLKAPLKIRPDSFAELLKLAGRLAADDAAVRKLGKIANLAVLAAQNHTFNGQAAIPWGGPLNGQRFRQRMFERLMRLGSDAIVETGTYLGTSTAFFARHGVPVHSCELRDEFMAAALSQVSAFDNVTLYLMDSRAFLRELAGDCRFEAKRPFFYLDAHWYDDLPLADEIRIIQERWAEHIIMVDDFQVPAAGYNFDRYANGLELTLDHLQREGVDLSQTAVLFPTASHTAETSARRGTLVLVSLDLYERDLRNERSMFRYVSEGEQARQSPQNEMLASASES